MCVRFVTRVNLAEYCAHVSLFLSAFNILHVKMSRKSIRNQSDIIIGKGLFKDLSNEIRLPTSELVIKRLFCYRLENPNSDVTRRDICTQVFQELKTVWQKAKKSAIVVKVAVHFRS